MVPGSRIRIHNPGGINHGAIGVLLRVEFTHYVVRLDGEPQAWSHQVPCKQVVRA